MSTFRKVSSVVALAAALVALALGLGEAALRVLAPRHNMSAVEYEPVRGWRGRPNARLVFDRPSFSIEVVQNSMGYRDGEHAVTKPAGGFRILCCGDSFTWGWGVDQDQIYTHELEEMCVRVDPGTEVINAGVSGQNSTQALLGLLDHGFAYEPDLVVYQASDNDIEGNLPGSTPGIWVSPHHVLGEDGELELKGSPVPRPGFWSELKYRAALHSRLAYLLRHRLNVLVTRLRDADRVEEGAGGLGDGASEVAFELFCAIVLKMDTESRERGAHFAVLIDFPMPGERMDYWRRHCGAVEALFIHDYLTDLEQRNGRPAYMPRDGHWTADGHRWVAEYIFENVALPLLDSSKSHQLRY